MTLTVDKIILEVMELESGLALVDKDLSTVQQSGFVDDPDDRGGLTSIWGITQKFLDEIRSNYDAKSLSVREALRLYKKYYFEKPGIAAVYEVNPWLARAMFNLSVHGGPNKAIKQFQSLMNFCNNNERYFDDLMVDGIFGKKSLSALEDYSTRRRSQDGQDVLYISYLSLTASFYFDIMDRRPNQEKYFYGWMRRIEKDLEEYYRAK